MAGKNDLGPDDPTVEEETLDEGDRRLRLLEVTNVIPWEADAHMSNRYV